MSSLRELGLLLLGTSGVTIIGYYAIINVYYSIIHFLALFELQSSIRESGWNPPFRPFDSPFFPGIAVLVPAYNEAATIEESLNALLSLNYPDSEIVVINDGSTDGTFSVLEEEFDLTPLDVPIPYEVPSEPIQNVYRSKTHEALLVIDKENGGKSDALNAGLWMTEKELFCAVDSDTLIERDALLQIVRPFLRDPERAVASGGTIRVANDCEIENGQVQEVNLPKTGLPGLQVMEYLRAFYSGRLGLNRLRGLILISGAFGLFRSDYVREIGGYRHDTVTEDFDLVVRLHRYLTDRDLDYRVDFVPEPVAWTEVPSSRRILGRQRRRWYRGMIETLVTNRDMLFNRAYGRVGTVILPLFTAAEALGPLVEGLGYLLIPLAWYLGAFNIEFFVVFLLLTTGFGIFLSWFGIFSEVWSYNRYEHPQEIVRLLWYGVLENFGYRQWKVLIAWQGLFEYLRGEQSWGVMERSGFGQSETHDSKTVTDTPAIESKNKEERKHSSDRSPDGSNWVGNHADNTSETDFIWNDDQQGK
jgi:cellulose synthase/poly-beta-1,6-N-acetylglucosamine synthase-like glycosyltransferase